ncbi:MAG: bifunctional YncE family protein/alkaline phosphatase family protein [Myxococcota bacterium]
MNARAGFLLLGVLVACGDTSPGSDGAIDAEAEDAGEDAGPPACRTDDHPTPVSADCTVTINAGAELPVGDDEGGYILPDARRVTRVGAQIELPGFPMTVRPVPGTRFAIVSDGGVDDEVLSVIDVDTQTVVDQRLFRERPSEATFLGVAIPSDGSRVYVAGGGTNLVWVYDFDTATGQLTDREPIVLADLVADGYVSGIRLLSDDTTLVANLMFGAQIVLWDTETNAERARIPIPDESNLPYDLVITPDDATAFVSLWDASAVLAIDLEGGVVLDTIPVGKNPEGLAISPDGSTVVAADSDSDSLSVIDTGLRERTDQVFIAGESALRGSSPAAGRFAIDGSRFFVVNAGDNAIDVFDTSDWSRLGRIPTMWYPTDVAVLGDGRVLVLAGKHEGTGANDRPAENSILDLLGGSLSVIEEITDADLLRWDTEIAANNDRATRFTSVSCEGDAAFPIPRRGGGASEQIRHVILVVRENKTYDAYFGDLTDDEGNPYGNGDPNLTLIPRSEIEDVIPNTRRIARDFAMGDNYYSLAEQSVQGHIWTTWGRSTDFVERSWLSTWGRGYWSISPQGVRDTVGYPEEGSAFDYFEEQGVSLTNYGEIVSSRNVAPHPRYPGLVYNMGVADEERARWLERRWQESCQLTSFTYVLLPNDHTFGLAPGRPTPRSMMADNDYAVGIIADAISHSTFWPETVVFFIEDDPQNGGDHVDNHRAPLLVLSPWVKRGYVSSVHYNEASIFRTIQLILGLPEPLNQSWANASPMDDLFSATPDYTPYEAIERRWPEEINGEEGRMAAESLEWDWSKPDEQPGLGRMLWRHLRGSEPPWPVSRDEILEQLEEAWEDD